MIHKTQITEMARKIARRQAGVLHDYQIMHPMRDWIIGLSIAITIFFVGAATSAQIYFSNINTLVESEAAAEEVVVYRESAVQAALQRLREREAVFNQLQLRQTQSITQVAPVSTTTESVAPILESVSSSTEPTVESPASDVIIQAPL